MWDTFTNQWTNRHGWKTSPPSNFIGRGNAFEYLQWIKKQPAVRSNLTMDGKKCIPGWLKWKSAGKRCRKREKTKSLGSLFCWFGLKENILSVLCWRREDRLSLLPAVTLARLTRLTNTAKTKCVCVCAHMCCMCDKTHTHTVQHKFAYTRYFL